MRILLLGKNGQVGWELQRSLSVIGEVIALDRSQAGGDLSEPMACSNFIRREKPDVVVNAAAYTAVDQGESETELCRRINATAVGEIATACSEIGALLVHYSTDYVFDGSGTQSRGEDDATGPINTYGKTKLEGEVAIRNSGCRHLIFRTSWVYGARGNNFAKTMLRLAQQRETLSVISDQCGVPTGADLIADVTAHATRICRLSDDFYGVYHLAPEGETTWFDYAKLCIETARTAGVAIRVRPDAILPIPSAEYKTAAVRPLNSRLNVKKIQDSFGLVMPDWQCGADRLLKHLLMKGIYE